ncbi:hypothetical protein SAMN05216489_08514 [Streptomyces sp. 3213]|nr:hypothetical protein SAMN05216489_08514 [Streptomyces sp. 3213] [Streptomyces sp. 3213.3]
MEGYAFGLPGSLSGRHDGRHGGLGDLVDALWEEPPGNATPDEQRPLPRR